VLSAQIKLSAVAGGGGGVLMHDRTAPPAAADWSGQDCPLRCTLYATINYTAAAAAASAKTF